MQEFQDQPARRERKEELIRASAPIDQPPQTDRRQSGEPAKMNTRSERRRIGWENDLYERQSM